MFDRAKFLSRDYSAKKSYLTEILVVLEQSQPSSEHLDHIHRVRELLALPIISEETLIALFDEFLGVVHHIMSTQHELLNESLSHIHTLLEQDAHQSAEDADALLSDLG